MGAILMASGRVPAITAILYILTSMLTGIQYLRGYYATTAYMTTGKLTQLHITVTISQHKLTTPKGLK
jgi:hypothetical protein